jgi:hypothetical protein
LNPQPGKNYVFIVTHFSDSKKEKNDFNITQTSVMARLDTDHWSKHSTPTQPLHLSTQMDPFGTHATDFDLERELCLIDEY